MFEEKAKWKKNSGAPISSTFGPVFGGGGGVGIKVLLPVTKV